MKTNAFKLQAAMKAGRVYRRQELEHLSTAIDRDLKTLVRNGALCKLAGGLYYRPESRNAFGAPPPEPKELVRSFLKTDDFLLTSRNDFALLGLGFTQAYNGYVVYNHRRNGPFLLGGRRFLFRLVPAYPRTVTREYLLVDLLNNLRKLPDNVRDLHRNLKPSLTQFDMKKVFTCVEKYGSPFAKRAMKEACA